MLVHYSSDGELSAVMTLDNLIANFNGNDGWKYRHNEEDMRDGLTSCGWYKGNHEHGHYLVLNLQKLGLIASGERTS